MTLSEKFQQNEVGVVVFEHVVDVVMLVKVYVHVVDVVLVNVDVVLPMAVINGMEVVVEAAVVVVEGAVVVVNRDVDEVSDSEVVEANNVEHVVVTGKSKQLQHLGIRLMITSYSN